MSLGGKLYFQLLGIYIQIAIIGVECFLLECCELQFGQIVWKNWQNLILNLDEIQNALKIYICVSKPIKDLHALL